MSSRGRVARPGVLLRTVPVSSNQLPVTLGRFDRASALPTLGASDKAENQALETSFATHERKSSPRCSKFVELVEAGAGRREQHDLARLRAARGRRDGSLERPGLLEARTGARQRAPRSLRRLADQVGAGRRSRRSPAASASNASPLPRAAEDQVHAARAKAASASQRGGGVRRLGVVHVADAAELGHRLEAVRRRPGTCAAPRRSRRRRRRPPAPPRSRRRRSRGCARRGSAARPAAGRRRVELDAAPVTGHRAEPARQHGHVLGAGSRRCAAWRAVGLERAVAVEVVGLDVEQHGDAQRRARRCPRAGSSTARRRPRLSGRARPASSQSGRPTLPATSTLRPAARNIAPSSSVVVVLPLVPVTPTKRVGRAAGSQLDLAPDRNVRACAPPHQRRLGRHAGALDEQLSTPSSKRSLSTPSLELDARSASSLTSGSVERSTATTVAPRRARAERRRPPRPGQAQHEHAIRQLAHWQRRRKLKTVKLR